MPPDELQGAMETVAAADATGNPAELLWSLIIRPPRSKYAPEQLGPTHFRLGKHSCVRRADVDLRNPRGHKLRCSLFEPLPRGVWDRSRTSRASASSRTTPAAPSSPPSGGRRGGAPPSSSAAASSGRASPHRATALTLDSVDLVIGRQAAPLPPWGPLATTSPSPDPAVVAGLLDPAGGGAAAGPMAPMGSNGLPVPGPVEPLPCVVFLHGNSSCRLEALPLITLLAPLRISLFCFDFSGCGLSEGEYISLGWFERDDLATCVDFLRSTGRVSTIALWGRSMGAFTALLHADRDPSIAGLVLDSPFVCLRVLAEELARDYAKVPSWMVRAVLSVVRHVVQSKAGFDIEDLQALEHATRSYSPALFVAACGDTFILPHHARQLYEAYQGERELRMVDGDHNSTRPVACRREAALFLCRAFHCERLDRLLEMHASGLYDVFSGGGGSASSTTPSGGCGGSGGGRRGDCDGRGSADDGGALICQQMHAVFPALRSMRLVHGRRCHRPLQARVSLRLQQETSEAGLFLALEPASGSSGGGAGRGSSPRFLLLAVSTEALAVSRIRDDSLETVCATAGLPVRESQQLKLEIDRYGNLRVQLGTDPPVCFSCGHVDYREQVALWLMVLHGQTSFGALVVEDSEATLCEHLGDAVLRRRHLGSGSPARAPAHGPEKAAAASCGPVALPRGDSGTLPTFGGPPSPISPQAVGHWGCSEYTTGRWGTPELLSAYPTGAERRGGGAEAPSVCAEAPCQRLNCRRRQPSWRLPATRRLSRYLRALTSSSSGAAAAAAGAA